MKKRACHVGWRAKRRAQQVRLERARRHVREGFGTETQRAKYRTSVRKMLGRMEQAFGWGERRAEQAAA